MPNVRGVFVAGMNMFLEVANTALAFTEQIAIMRLQAEIGRPHPAIIDAEAIGRVSKKAAAAMYDECARVLVAGGRLLTFGQDTNGPGERRGFRLVQVGVVPHGGSHSDTLVAEWVLERHVPMRKPLAPAVMGA